jgi:SET domain-containing protein
VIKTEKELLRLIWKEMGLGGHNADIKKRTVIANEVHKSVDFRLRDLPPEKHEEMLDAIAGLFLSRIGDMKEEEFTKAFYTNLLSSITPVMWSPEIISRPS